jgi:hypothetical protein
MRRFSRADYHRGKPLASEPGVALSMSLTQRISAYAAILAFGVPSVLIAILGGEAWPFLDYRMYAEAKFTPEVDWLTLVGRTDNGASFPLDDERYIVPFASSELLRALYALDIFGETDMTPARRALQGLLAAYEQNRLAGEHHGPRLLSLEVYRVHWHARPGAFYAAVPDSQEFLQAVDLPEAVP